MEFGGSLPHSQQSTTCPYPGPNQSIPLPITILTAAACFLPGRAKGLSAPRVECVKENVKLCLSTSFRRMWGVEVWLYSFLNSALDRG